MTTGCDTRMVRCEECDGLGDYDKPHPMWGSPSCPEAYVHVKCRACDGTGQVEVDVEPVDMEDEQ